LYGTTRLSQREVTQATDRLTKALHNVSKDLINRIIMFAVLVVIYAVE
jgi:t-SNARE complex subunit (syntaxin)